MNNTHQHRERLERCLAGESSDRVPVALWRHFPVDDQSAEGLAASIVNFQHMYDFDFIKVTPASSYCIKDWGVEDQWNGSIEGTRDYTKFPIRQPEDWGALKELDPRKGHLGEQLSCLRLIRAEFSLHTPIVPTIFSPLTQAKNLVGKEKLQIYLRKYPDELLAGLKRITETTIRFIEEMRSIQIDGIFYAIQHASYSLNSEDEFIHFGKTFDLKVLETVKDLWLNIAHIHGEDIMFNQVADYPVQIINWHDRHTVPSLSEAQTQFTGAVCGGLRRWETMAVGDPQTIRAEAYQAINQTGGRRFILGTGCVMPIITPHTNILAARHSVD